MAGRSEKPEHGSSRSRLQYWVQAEVHCMLCERSIGSVLGVAVRRGDAPAACELRVAFFRSAQPAVPTLITRGGERFQCATCGGNGVVEQLEEFATEIVRDEPHDRPRRSRRPKQAVARPDWRLEAFGIRYALSCERHD